ncbi:hypothetical protein [Mycetohabitans endofungorum]|uniref:hypothetical protein n=1 Tax=Mycetohabitans endofungorum TaxID=417203 RepID=UPI002B061A9F|nr:hypothetical protein [Mycetohabitans endofungorum]
MSKQVIGDLHPRETMRRAWVSVLFTLLRFASRRARTQSAISDAESRSLTLINKSRLSRS